VRIEHPYPGLRPFERHESRIFFGREKQENELLDRLKQHHFLAVLGASGSGKSSLVKAGLLPALAKGYMGEVGADWSIAELRPGDQPFARLAEALLQDERFQRAWKPSTTDRGDNTGKNVQDSAFLAAALRRGARSLHEVLETAPLPGGNRLLIVVDQFEEIFRYRTQAEDHAAAFVALLLESCKHEDIYIVITMRSDFLGKAAEFQGLPEAINAGLYLTPRLTREQLADAIGKPARLFGGKVEDDLTNHLCNEAGNNPDQLPLLQHALMCLWEQDQDKTLTLDEYRQLNGLQGALDGHAEQAWKELDADGQRIAESLFRALTERSREGQDIRRPAKVQEILDLTKAGLETLTRVVDVFRQPGRNFLMASPPGELTPDTTLDISHESLIRQWRRLQGWVAAEGEKAEMLKRLSEAAERSRNKQGELWRGTDLALALRWQDEQQPLEAWAARYFNLSPHPNPLPGGEGNKGDPPSHPGGGKENPLSRPGEGGGEGSKYPMAMRFLAKSAAMERRRKLLKRGGAALAFLALAIFAAVQYPAAQAERERRSPIYRAEDWVRIEPGEFCMGSRGEKDPKAAECPDMPADPEAQDYEKPLHRVKIAKPFLLAKHEVTFEEYDRFVYDNLDQGMRLPSDSGFGAKVSPEQRKRLPVINVSWQDAKDYAAWLTRRTGKRFRLPTEAEWEYAARAGTLTPRPWEGGLEAACRYANVLDSEHVDDVKAAGYSITWDNFPCPDNYAFTAPVGSFEANAFGIKDMMGNVWEWVEDCYHENYGGAPASGTTWEEMDCGLRVVRGGSWLNVPWLLRASFRYWNGPDYRYFDLGFRLAQDL
jgi:formylglycine-generating enzyme required for sulfatase activity